MSIEAAADLVAKKLLEQDFVEVHGHHDADGIAAASILCHALNRSGKHFHLSIDPYINPKNLKNPGSTLLCDFGSALDGLHEDVMVIDHHPPHFNGKYHVNPHLNGLDGERELSASGAAYIVALHMGDNRDLCGLAMIGMIGDRQELTGMNHEIVSEGIANGFILPRRGLCFVGRDLTEQLYTALNPYLKGISGKQDVVDSIVETCTSGADTDMEILLSKIILEIAPYANSTLMENLYGDTYELEREVVHDLHTLTAIVDACGQAGRGGLAATLCLRSPDGLDEAWEILRQYRQRVISALGSAEKGDDQINLYELTDPEVTSAVADALAYDGLYDTPVVTIAGNTDEYFISARSPGGMDPDLGSTLKDLAAKCGGTGGGHRTRAGARINADGIECFKTGIMEAIFS